MATPTLEFTKVFPKGHKIKYHDVRTILQCKNIYFNHTHWTHNEDRGWHNNVAAVKHIVDNIIDMNAHDNNMVYLPTFFGTIIICSKQSAAIHYVLNNGGINNYSFTSLYGNPDCMFTSCCSTLKDTIGRYT